MFIGPSGVCKTQLAIALDHNAAKAAIKTQMLTVTDLILKLAVGQHQGRFVEVQRTPSRARRMIIDVIGYLPLNRNQASLLFQLVAARSEQGTTIISSNLNLRTWNLAFVGGRFLTAAMLDRSLHHAHIMQMQGDSYRLTGKRGTGIIEPP